MRTIKTTVYRSRKPIGRQRWRFRVVASNGKRLAQGEAYTNKDECFHAARLVVGYDVPIEVEP